MIERRDFMRKSSGAVALGLAASAGLVPAVSRAQAGASWNKAAFEAKSLNDVVKAMGGAAPTESKDVVLAAPEIAENGSVVRIGAQSNLPGTTSIAFVVEKNPNALAAVFDIPEGTDANVATNVKMGQSSHVYAVARVGDKFFYSAKEVKVTLGGCGG